MRPLSKRHQDDTGLSESRVPSDHKNWPMLRPRLLRFSELTLPRRVLVRLCQSLNFGQIQGLLVRDANPVFDPAPVVLFEAKLDSDEGSRPEIELPDFELRDEVCRLIVRLEELKNGVIELIDVRAGLPRRMIIRCAANLGAFHSLQSRPDENNPQKSL